MLFLQESIDDVAQTINEELQYDAEVAEKRNIEFRVSHVLEYHCW